LSGFSFFIKPHQHLNTTPCIRFWNINSCTKFHALFHQ
jgi:hypothetical protein